MVVFVRRRRGTPPGGPVSRADSAVAKRGRIAQGLRDQKTSITAETRRELVVTPGGAAAFERRHRSRGRERRNPRLRRLDTRTTLRALSTSASPRCRSPERRRAPTSDPGGARQPGQAQTRPPRTLEVVIGPVTTNAESVTSAAGGSPRRAHARTAQATARRDDPQRPRPRRSRRVRDERPDRLREARASRAA